MDRFWGLRLLANGASSGLDVVIFGGQRGDLPLAATHGAAIAEIVGTTSTPVILVTRQMTVADRTRFFTDFAETLVRKNSGPLHLVIDEAHLFMPQQGAKVAGGVPAMLHAGNNLVALGRGIGLRIILLSQRPAKLHKDSLTQVETLVAMRLIAPQDRNAIREWIREWADEHTGAALMASLPSLPTGSGWLWAPELDILREIKFPRIHTFDSGKALAPGTPAPVLRPLDIGAVSRQLAQVAEEAAANDPRRLKVRIADLERQLAAANAGAKVNMPDELAIAEERGAARGRREVMERVPAMGRTLTDAIVREIGRQLGGLAEPDVPRGTPGYTEPLYGTGRGRAVAAASRLRDEQPIAHPVRALFKPALPHGLRTCLIAVAQHRDGIDRDQLTVLTGYKRSTRDAYIRKLLGRGDVAVVGDGRVIATQAGVAELGEDYQPLPTGAGLRDYWLNRLPDGERRVLEVLLQAFPNGLLRADIDVTTGYKRSTRDAYLRRLITRRLVEFGGSGMRASSRLFDA
jgi:hypothetical protein